MSTSRTPLAAVGLLAILGLCGALASSQPAQAGASNESAGLALKADPSLRDFAAPLAAPTFCSAAPDSLGTGAPALAGTAEAFIPAALLRTPTASEADRLATLIAARILLKYLHFRESLSSP